MQELGNSYVLLSEILNSQSVVFTFYFNRFISENFLVYYCYSPVYSFIYKLACVTAYTAWHHLHFASSAAAL